MSIGQLAKEAAHAVVSGFNRDAAVVFLPPGTAECLELGQKLVNTTLTPESFTGRKPTAKEVRTFLWNMRHTRPMHRDRWALWGWWHAETEVAYLGLAEAVAIETSERLYLRDARFKRFNLET